MKRKMSYFGNSLRQEANKAGMGKDGQSLATWDSWMVWISPNPRRHQAFRLHVTRKNAKRPKIKKLGCLQGLKHIRVEPCAASHHPKHPSRIIDIIVKNRSISVVTQRSDGAFGAEETLHHFLLIGIGARVTWIALHGGH